MNETLSAFLQPGAGRGLGTITAWATEVVLPITGSMFAPSKGSPRPDAVLHAPEADPPLPLLCVEVGTSSEPPAAVAAKFERYRRFFRRTATAPGAARSARPGPLWPTLYPAAPGTGALEGHPPVAVMFTGAGPRGLANRMAAVEDLSRARWAGHTRTELFWGQANFHGRDYTDAIPVLGTAFPELQQHGPHGPVWRRFGHGPDRAAREDLATALANPEGETALARHREEIHRHREQEEATRLKEQREQEHRQETAERRRREHAAREAARLQECRRCRQPRQDDRWPELPADLRMDRRRVPPPDGEHCAACRVALNPTYTERGRIGRLLRGS